MAVTDSFGVPVRVARSLGPDGKPAKAETGRGDEASVDSELALLGAFAIKTDGPIKNPYFRKDAPFTAFDSKQLFLVCRLDGPSPEVVQRMITDDADLDAVRKAGFADGMRSLRLSGAQKVGAGLTTIAEVLRVAPVSQDT